MGDGGIRRCGDVRGGGGGCGWGGGWIRTGPGGGGGAVSKECYKEMADGSRFLNARKLWAS